MGKSPGCTKVPLKKGPWSPEEDQKLLTYIEKHGLSSWLSLPAKAGLQRCGKSCRLRWRNYLRPDIKRGKFSLKEEQTIIQLHAFLGNRWSVIANQLPRRTDNEIKNHWNTHLKKRLSKMGIDPVTHKRKSNAVGSIQSKDAANISHLTQWETARLEAEGRLAPKSSILNHFDIHPPVGLSASALPLNRANGQGTGPAPLPLLVVPPCLDVLRASQGAWKIKPNGYFSRKGSLTSPTSTLHLPNDIFSSSSAGSGAMSPTFPEINCFGNSTNAYKVGIAGQQIQKNVPEVEEIRVGRCFQHHDFPLQPIGPGDNNIAGSLRLPSLMEGFAGHSCPSWPSTGQQWKNEGGSYDHNCDGNGLGPCGCDLEENDKYYWNHILNASG